MFEYEGRRFYAVASARRASSASRLRARGRAGHGRPGLGDNALLKLAPVLTRLNDQPPLEPTPAGVAFLSACSTRPVGAEPGGARRCARRAARALAAPRRLPGRADAAGDAGPHHGARLEKDNVIPSAAPRPWSTAASRPGSVRTRSASASPRCSATSATGRDRVRPTPSATSSPVETAARRCDRRLAGRGRPRGDPGPDGDARLLATATGSGRRSTRRPSTASIRSASSTCSPRPR